jgi:hypothetical protein
MVRDESGGEGEWGSALLVALGGLLGVARLLLK